jgi:hypothetical protein
MMIAVATAVQGEALTGLMRFLLEGPNQTPEGPSKK